MTLAANKPRMPETTVEIRFAAIAPWGAGPATLRGPPAYREGSFIPVR
jgi:hypothetical protein